MSKFLHELEYSGIARRLDDEWIRYDPRHDEGHEDDNQQHGIEEDTASQENDKQNQVEEFRRWGDYDENDICAKIHDFTWTSYLLNSW